MTSFCSPPPSPYHVLPPHHVRARTLRRDQEPHHHRRALPRPLRRAPTPRGPVLPRRRRRFIAPPPRSRDGPLGGPPARPGPPRGAVVGVARLCERRGAHWADRAPCRGVEGPRTLGSPAPPGGRRRRCRGPPGAQPACLCGRGPGYGEDQPRGKRSVDRRAPQRGRRPAPHGRKVEVRRRREGEKRECGAAGEGRASKRERLQ